MRSQPRSTGYDKQSSTDEKKFYNFTFKLLLNRQMFSSAWVLKVYDSDFSGIHTSQGHTMLQTKCDII